VLQAGAVGLLKLHEATEVQTVDSHTHVTLDGGSFTTVPWPVGWAEKPKRGGCRRRYTLKQLQFIEWCYNRKETVDAQLKPDTAQYVYVLAHESASY
jgi:hypothetical protein